MSIRDIARARETHWLAEHASGHSYGYGRDLVAEAEEELADAFNYLLAGGWTAEADRLAIVADHLIELVRARKGP